MALPTATHCSIRPDSLQAPNMHTGPLSSQSIVALAPAADADAWPHSDVSHCDILAMATVHALAQWSTAGPVVLWYHDTDRSLYAGDGDISRTVGRLDALYPVSFQLNADTALPLIIRQIKQALRTAQNNRHQQALAALFDQTTHWPCSASRGAVLLCIRDGPLEYSFGSSRAKATVHSLTETNRNEICALGPWAMIITLCRKNNTVDLELAHSPLLLTEASISNLVNVLRDSLEAMVQCYMDTATSPMHLWVPADFAQVELSLAEVDELD
ncbi:hypothetical protein H4R34_006204, partial [Dimargaris verticillata]